MRDSAIPQRGGGLLEAVSFAVSLVMVAPGIFSEWPRGNHGQTPAHALAPWKAWTSQSCLSLVWANPVPAQESWISTQFLPSWSFLPGLGQPKPL